MTRLTAGDPAPSFELTADDGSTVSSDALAGRRYVLVFYPEDDSAGCTAQACALRDAWEELVGSGVPIYGVSPDSRERHAQFRAKHGLPYPLLVDEGHVLADAYGVWVEKQAGDRVTFGNERTTFVVGSDATVQAVLARVKPADHAGLLIEALA
ncbi:MAG: peroxiredoxin [Chloroflexi bacterium]|nr:peroxiredoxin [Chloroflexota bacterium]